MERLDSASGGAWKRWLNMAAVSAVLVLDHYLRHHGQQETSLEAERFSAATRERDRELSTRCLVRLFATLLSCEEPSLMR
jgi:hypothetical protein